MARSSCRCSAPAHAVSRGSRNGSGTKPDNTASDKVNRAFARSGPNQLWVTDITEHPTREGKVYCCVVLDAYRDASSAGRSTPRRPLPWLPTRSA